tara:strand:- start:398 stop:544 length:147 start_codon:yes stop_codon:yes gene_type:complete
MNESPIDILLELPFSFKDYPNPEHLYAYLTISAWQAGIEILDGVFGIA